MFKEIKNEKAFDGILNQNDGRDDGSIQTGGTGSLKST